MRDHSGGSHVTFNPVESSDIPSHVLADKVNKLKATSTAAEGVRPSRAGGRGRPEANRRAHRPGDACAKHVETPAVHVFPVDEDERVTRRDATNLVGGPAGYQALDVNQHASCPCVDALPKLDPVAAQRAWWIGHLSKRSGQLVS